MKTRYCRLVREQLDAFVDGELTGAERLDVAQHVNICASCSRVVDELSAVGDALRATAAEADRFPQDLAGLASGVISRTTAEAAESWQGVFRRATGDRHWLLVGSGALAATFLTGLFTTALLAFGPEPERSDSLAKYAPPKQAERASLVSVVEARLVDQLAIAVNAPGSARLNVDPQSRLIQEALLDEITRLRLDEPMMVGRPATERVAVSWVVSRRPADVLIQ